MQLNPAQLEAIACVRGPCLVLAGAGSGKTRVIASKITALICRHGLLPEKICALTFTNKATAEMRSRVTGTLGSDIAKRLQISTFHALGLKIIRQEHACLQLGRNFSLFNEYDTQKILREIVNSDFSGLLKQNPETRLLRELGAAISQWKHRLTAPEEVGIRSDKVQIYRRYCDYLKACSAVDFDDLLYLPVRMLLHDEQIREHWHQVFDYMLVDEYQDTSEPQYQLLKLLSARTRSFTVVGDDDQSIYAWRGARPENLISLARDFPDLKVIKLEQNYRSTGHILHCANVLIAHNEHLYPKTLYTSSTPGRKIRVIETATEAAESERVAGEIAGQHCVNHRPWKDFAILYRSNYQSRSLEKSLHAARIPCVITGGSSFFELPEIKDLLSWCRIICNPRDDAALLRVINIPRRGIGPDTISVLSAAARSAGRSMFDSALNPTITSRLKPRQLQALGSFVALLTDLRQLLLAREDVLLARELPQRVGYEIHLRAISPSREAASYKLKNAQLLMSWIGELIAGKNGEPPVSFAVAVDKLGLREMPERQDGTSTKDAVQLMTLHSAKGLEFPCVFLVGMEEGVLPHRNSLELPGGIAEERRLAYVGITRARCELTLLLSRVRSVNGSEKELNSPSRFLKELPPEDLEWQHLGEKTEISRAEQVRYLEETLSQLGLQQ